MATSSTLSTIIYLVPHIFKTFIVFITMRCLPPKSLPLAYTFGLSCHLWDNGQVNGRIYLLYNLPPMVWWPKFAHGLFHWSASLDKVMQKCIKPSLEVWNKQICKEYKDAKKMDDMKIKYHVIRLWWMYSCHKRRHHWAFQSDCTYVTSNRVVICYL